MQTVIRYFRIREALWPVYLMYLFALIITRNTMPDMEIKWYQAVILLLTTYLSMLLYVGILMRKFDFSSPLQLQGARQHLVRRLIFTAGLAYGVPLVLCSVQVLTPLRGLVCSVIALMVIVLLPLKSEVNNSHGVVQVLDRLGRWVFGVDYLDPQSHPLQTGKGISNLIALLPFLAGLISALLPAMLSSARPMTAWGAFFAMVSPLSIGAALSWIAIQWRRIAAALGALLPASWIVILLCGFCAGGLMCNQGQDALRSLTLAGEWIRFCALVLLFVLIAYVTLYSALFVARIRRVPSQVLDEAGLRRAQTVFPHILVGSTTLIMMRAALTASGAGQGFLMAWGVFAGCFAVFMIYALTLMEKGDWCYRLLTVLPFFLFPRDLAQRLLANRLTDAKRPLVLLICVAVIWAIALIVMLLDEGKSAQKLGPYTILIAACALWIGVTGFLQVAVNKSAAVIIPILAILVLCFSPWRNNHQVTALPQPAQARPLLSEVYRAYCGQFSDSASRRHPVIVVAEGGGIRSSYWVARMMGALYDSIPGFRNRMLAVSTVSGGSVGANMFLGLAGNDTSGNYGKRIEAIAGQDFLSPLFGKLLFPEIIQRFLPCNIPGFSPQSDRGRALDLSFERAMVRGGTGAPVLSQGIIAENAGLHLPAIFINVSRVENGVRGVIATARLDHPVASMDLLDSMGMNADMKWSSAMSLSARFPVLSPGVRIMRDRKPWGHLVDGGYHDNSGLLTVREILHSLPDSAEPILVLIRNQVAIDTAAKPVLWYNEIYDIASGLLTVLEARSVEDVALCKAEHGRYRVIELHLDLPESAVPMGWYLSERAKASVNTYLDRVMTGDTTLAAGRNLIELKKLL